jgi:8-oxo-dGTP diphosphatase
VATGSREENASKQKTRASVLIQSEPKRLYRFDERLFANLDFAAARHYMVVAAHEIANMGREMARASTLAAGGIVLRQGETPLIAVVRLRKRNEWVLPKGRVDDGETPRDAAEREVLEETGHDVSVHEFLGTLVYEIGGRSKVVHYWRMAASGEPSHDLMDDVRAVDWLPLDAAVERLSRGYERAFLANVGPLALEAAALARPSQRPKAKQRAPEKRPGRQAVAPRPSLAIPVSAAPQPDHRPSAIGPDERQSVAGEVVEAKASIPPTEFGTGTQSMEADPAAPAAGPESSSDATAATAQSRRRNLIQKMRDWLRRAA